MCPGCLKFAAQEMERAVVRRGWGEGVYEIIPCPPTLTFNTAVLSPPHGVGPRLNMSAPRKMTLHV